MKRIILTLSLLIGISAVSMAQCDKIVVLNSSKTEHLDPAGTVTKTVDEKAEIEIGKTEVNVAIDGDHKITAIIKSNTCNWTVPFKDGKTVIQGVAQHDGEDKKVTFTIEGKDGKVTLLFEMEEEPNDRIRVSIEKFAEKA